MPSLWVEAHNILFLNSDIICVLHAKTAPTNSKRCACSGKKRSLHYSEMHHSYYFLCNRCGQHENF